MRQLVPDPSIGRAVRGKKFSILAAILGWQSGAFGGERVVMTLSEMTDNLDSYRDPNLTSEPMVICAKRPWSASTEVKVVELEEPELSVPERILIEGSDYMPEIEVVAEVLEDVESADFSLEDEVELVVFYAEQDAYPEWANRRIALANR